MHRLLFRAYNIDGAMNVAWRGARRSERSSSGGGNQFAYGEIFERTCAEDGNGIIDLGRGRTVRSSNLSGVSRTFRHPPPWRIKKKKRKITSSFDMENTTSMKYFRGIIQKYKRF